MPCCTHLDFRHTGRLGAEHAAAGPAAAGCVSSNRRPRHPQRHRWWPLSRHCPKAILLQDRPQHPGQRHALHLWSVAVAAAVGMKPVALPSDQIRFAALTSRSIPFCLFPSAPGFGLWRDRRPDLGPGLAMPQLLKAIHQFNSIMFYFNTSSNVVPCAELGGVIPSSAAIVGVTSTGWTSRWIVCASMDGPAKIIGTWVS